MSYEDVLNIEDMDETDFTNLDDMFTEEERIMQEMNVEEAINSVRN